MKRVGRESEKERLAYVNTIMKRCVCVRARACVCVCVCV